MSFTSFPCVFELLSSDVTQCVGISFRIELPQQSCTLILQTSRVDTWTLFIPLNHGVCALISVFIYPVARINCNGYLGIKSHPYPNADRKEKSSCKNNKAYFPSWSIHRLWSIDMRIAENKTCMYSWKKVFLSIVFRYPHLLKCLF